MNTIENQIKSFIKSGCIVIFTDGGASGNPGPGGWGAVLRYKNHTKELSGGYAHTTNNRMELTAVIEALKALKQSDKKVHLFSDSKYVVNSYTKGWAKKWQANGWKKSNKKRAENVDLWEELLGVCRDLDITFHWVKGHAGIELNERCDTLAKEQMQKNDLPKDKGYDNAN